jgi:hypothetical protein
MASLCAQPARAVEYFDAYNHITRILPYYGYAHLPAFIETLSAPDRQVGGDNGTDFADPLQKHLLIWEKP